MKKLTPVSVPPEGKIRKAKPTTKPYSALTERQRLLVERKLIGDLARNAKKELRAQAAEYRRIGRIFAKAAESFNRSREHLTGLERRLSALTGREIRTANPLTAATRGRNR